LLGKEKEETVFTENESCKTQKNKGNPCPPPNLQKVKHEKGNQLPKEQYFRLPKPIRLSP